MDFIKKRRIKNTIIGGIVGGLIGFIISTTPPYRHFCHNLHSLHMSKSQEMTSKNEDLQNENNIRIFGKI